MQNKRQHPAGLRRPPLRKAPFIVILTAILLGLVGISQGEPQRVLERAVQVCFSCIGIG
ncbi:MAG: CD1871A family CXXC motif-containing protein [Desulfurivibrio sp.]|nr:CD1871A family CXXC motif-containing protein [Desulfurivibrio sp.]